MLPNFRETASLCQHAVGSSRFVSHSSPVLRKQRVFFLVVYAHMSELSEIGWAWVMCQFLNPDLCGWGLEDADQFHQANSPFPELVMMLGAGVGPHPFPWGLTSMYVHTGYDPPLIMYTAKKAHAEDAFYYPLHLHPSFHPQTVFSCGCPGLKSWGRWFLSETPLPRLWEHLFSPMVVGLAYIFL